MGYRYLNSIERMIEEFPSILWQYVASQLVSLVLLREPSEEAIYMTILNAGSRSSPQPEYSSYFPLALSLFIFAQ